MRPEDRRADVRRLASGAIGVIGVLAVPVLGVAAVAAGWRAVVGAAAGLTLVMLLFAGSAALLSWVGERRPAGGAGLLFAGALGRLVFYALALSVLGGVDWIHRPSLAVATATGVAVTLAYELRLLSRMPRLFWIDAQLGRPHVVPTATRSQSL